VRLGPRQPLELYDLKNDLSESNNVAAAHPDVVKKITEIMQTARTDSKAFPVREAPQGKKKKG
jgi:hypothetical protein